MRGLLIRLALMALRQPEVRAEVVRVLAPELGRQATAAISAARAGALMAIADARRRGGGA